MIEIKNSRFSGVTKLHGGNIQLDSGTTDTNFLNSNIKVLLTARIKNCTFTSCTIDDSVLGEDWLEVFDSCHFKDCKFTSDSMERSFKKHVAPSTQCKFEGSL